MLLERLLIENFRGVKEGKLEALSPLSILVGPNNCGKSTALEAIEILGQGSDAHRVVEALLRRGGTPLHALAEAFHGEQREQAPLRVTGEMHRDEARETLEVTLTLDAMRDLEMVTSALREGLSEPMISVTLSWSSRPVVPPAQGTARKRHSSRCLLSANGKTGANFSASPITAGASVLPFAQFVDVQAVRSQGALEDAYSTLENARRVPAIVQALRRAMPALQDLRILKVGDHYVLHAVLEGERPTPVFAAGDGFKRLLEIAAAVHSKDHDVILLEEPECFQHPRYLGELVTVLRAAVADGKQVILSTHSVELIDHLLEPDDGAPTTSWPTVHRLRLTGGVLRATALTAERARAARHDLLEDLRA